MRYEDVLPRRVTAVLQTARRDLEMLSGRLLWGRRPEPLIRRSVPLAASVLPTPARRSSLARPVRVVDVARETSDAVSIYLTEHDGSPIQFLPGQFLSVDVQVGGETLRRAYSIASPGVPNAPVHITVKRMPDGRVSNRLNEQVSIGDLLQVLGPSGSFTLQAKPDATRELVMIAGGSGITPIISLAETALRAEPRSRIVLIYGNRSWDDIIFRERLAALVEEFPSRLVVDHVLEHPPAQWTGGSGLLCAEVLQNRLGALPELRADAQYFLCGPSPMMDAAHEVLRVRGVPADRIAEERFTHPEQRHSSCGSRAPQSVRFVLGGITREVEVAPGQTLLEAALQAGLDLPFSCAMGGCGACRVRRIEGELAMDEPNCLSRAERDQGYVLTCIGRPLSAARLHVEDS